MKNIKNNITLILLSLLLTTFFAGCFLFPPTNHAPSITSTEITTATVGEMYTYDVDATDPDGDTLTYSLTNKPADMTIDPITGVINWTPDTTGDYDVTIDVEDGTLNDIQSFIIKVSKSSPTSPPVTPPDNPEEPYLIEIASKEINLDEGGIVEVTDPESEFYGLQLIIEPQKIIQEKEKGITATFNICIAYVEGCKLPEYHGFLTTPIVVKSNVIDLICKLKIPYNDAQLLNSGVGINEPVKVCRVLSIPLFWEELSPDKYTVNNNMASIKIGLGDISYYYTLTVENTVPPDPSKFKHPMPGDLVYKWSKFWPAEINEGWLPGHVGIYVGLKYDEEEGKTYNVIEALLGGVTRSYYPFISSFGGNSVFLGAREPVGGLSHEKRKKIVAFVDNNKVIGKPYALWETASTAFLFSGLGRGNLVKGPDSYNCVGLAEAAYDSPGVDIDIVPNYDEGNVEYGSYHILTPAEQWNNMVPASGIIDQNIAPEISELKSTPRDSVETTKEFTISCYATDEDNDNLTYSWTIPGLPKPLIKGKDITWISPDISTKFTISCKVKDNYGGEDKDEVKVSILPDTFTITASAGSNGTIVPSGEIIVEQGSDQSFTITPNANYQVADVLVDGSSVGTESSYTFNNVTEDHSISANFIEEVINHAPVIDSSPITTATREEIYNYNVNAVDSDGDDLIYSLTTKPSGMIINSSTGLITWTPGTTGDFNVTVKVSDGDLFDAQDYIITVSSAVPETYTITASTGSNGSISPSGDVAVNEGSDQTFNIAPDSGYQIDDVLVDGSSIGVESSYTFTNVTQGHTISATFIENTSEVVEFEDPILEQVVREKINKPEGILYLNDVIGITELNANGRGILTLGGIEHLINLQSLIIGNDINGNHITDISPLSNLTNLKSLEFQYNQVSDISPLSNLTNLEYLCFYRNQVSDISVLSNLTNLKKLNIGDNQVTDISVLSNLTNLEYLCFYRNQVSDISPLSNLTNLQELSISNNQVSDISPLSNLTNLQSLTFFANQVSDISSLSNLTNLEYLWFGINPVSDISVLSNLTNLKELVFNSSQVSDISPLSNLTNLEYLWFSRNQVSDISALVNNVGFDTGDYIDMENNYLDLSEGSQNMQDIENLISRGVIVEYEPQNIP